MKRHFSLHCAVALAVVSYLSTGAWASPTFTYDWTPTVPVVTGDGGFNAINFSNQGPVTVSTGTVVGSATSLTVLNTNSDTFTNGGYNLGVKITDGSNSGTLTFSGVLNGVITNGVPESLTSTLTSQATQSIILGSDKFTVSMNGFVPPNPFGSGNKPGGFGFQIDALAGPGGGTAPPPPNNVPEPTTLLLSCLGAAGFAIRSWRKQIS